MQETTLTDYVSSQWAKSLFVAEAKAGKTVWLLGQLLGVWPTQKNGGVVDDPSHLHIITFDVKALKGALAFLIKKCGAPPDIGNVHVYNFEDDVRALADSPSDWDYSLYNSVLAAISKTQTIAEQDGGVHAMVVSSLTGLAAGVQRACFGRPGLGDKKGSGGDRAKWPAIGAQLSQVRAAAQMDGVHCIWEGHVDKVSTGTGADAEEKDSIGLQGQAGRTFAYNVGEVFRLRRFSDQRLPGTDVDNVVIDTSPNLSFFRGRDFHELKAQESDLTSVFHRLGYKVGLWNRKVAVAADASVSAPKKLVAKK